MDEINMTIDVLELELAKDKVVKEKVNNLIRDFSDIFE